MDANSKRIYGDNFFLYLRQQPGSERQILVKEPARRQPTPSSIEQLSNEYTLTKQLANIPGVRKVYAKEGSESHPLLCLEYIHGHTLAEFAHADTLDMHEKLRIAREIAGTLARIHENGVIHRDINASNILVVEDYAACENGGVYIIDFGIATTMRQQTPRRIARTDTSSGTLAYMSPEQTGRVNRYVDYRTDLYSLGVVLYELFTGQLPFEAGDTLETIHSHIARSPAFPHELDADIPRPVSDIILRLLAKNAEDRYQSAHGLQVDLQHCLNQWQTSHLIKPFDLGQDDYTGQLQIPQKLYGRQSEIEDIESAFDRVTQGQSELLIVTGYSGVGKTSLVHELNRPIAARRGYFIEGKFDQFQRGIPHLAWVQAFTELINMWLAESDDRINQLREAILEAFGKNGGALTEVIPNLEIITGPQPEVTELGGIESQKRFNYLFQSFVKTVAKPEHPLVIFLDDLQWIDLASLNLLKTLVTDLASGYLLIIGAFRDNEVTVTHPLIMGLNDLKERDATVNWLTLENLRLTDIQRLLSDSLHTPSEQCLPLARIVQAKTDGNAFFVHQILHTLVDKGLLSFDQDRRCWQWDMAELNKLTISDNVVELIIDRLQRLPDTTQNLLKNASCLGNQFESETLYLVSDLTPEVTREAIHAAHQEGFFVQIEEQIRFVHDHVQQAAYSLVPASEKAPLHRQIGRILLRETPPQNQNERLFAIVGHLNLGASLVETESEQIELAKLNMKAAQNALKATAYAAAEAYAQSGIGLLTANGWQAHYPLTLALHQIAAEAAYLNNDLEQSEQTIAIILAEAHSLIDRVPAHIMRIRVHHARNEMEEVINIGLASLKELGFPLDDSEPAGLSVQTVSELPVMTEPRAMAAMELLDSLLVTAYVSRPHLFPRIIFTSMHLTLDFGLHPASCMAVSTLGVLTWEDDINAAYQWGRLALKLVDRLRADRYLPQVKTVYDGFILPWKTDYAHAERETLSSIQMCLESGSKIFSTSAITTATYLSVIAGHPLEYAQDKISRYLQIMESIGEQYALYNVSIWRQFIANLRGPSAEPTQFEGAFYSESRDLPIAQAANMNVPVFFTYFLKMFVHCHLGDYSSAYTHSLEAEQLVHILRSHVTVPLFVFYQSLAILRMPDSQDRQPDVSKKLTENIRKLQLWAHHAPMNHQHKVDLVLAEQGRLNGNIATAMDHYDASIAGAKENKILHEEALANELYARFWIERGNEPVAQLYLREARALYDRWGAVAIVEHLETQYPQWLAIETPDVTRPLVDSSTSKALGDLDLHSIMKASQAIAGEIELERLLSRLMIIAMENAGAQRGCLILESEGQWVVEAAAETGQAEPQVMQGTSIDEEDLLSSGIAHYVARTQQTVVLENAAHEGEYVNDAYVQRHQVQSLLCMPLVNQGRIVAILYLENNLATSVFTPSETALLEILAGQMAISLDNARMVDQLEESLATRTRDLETAETQVRTMFENTPLGVALSTLEGDILAINQAFLRMTGYTETEMRQLNMASLYDDPGERTAGLKRLRAEKTLRGFDLRGRRKNGTIFFASAHVSPIVLDGKEVLLSIVEDVTDKMHAEETLRQSEEKFRIVAEQSPNMIFINQQDRVVFANQKAVEIMGYSLEELTAADFGFMTLIAPESTQLAQSSLAEHLQEKELPPHEYRLLTKAGERLESIITTKLIDYKGSKAILGIVTDVTLLKQTEDALLKANSDLAILLESSRTMTAALELDDLLKTILDQLGRVAKYVTAVIWIREGDELVAQASQTSEGIRPMFDNRMVLDAAPCVLEMMATRGPVTSDDSPTLSRLFQGAESTIGQTRNEFAPTGVQLLGIPLIAKDQLIGVLGLLDEEPGYYTLEKKELVQAFANQAAIAIENVQLHQEAQQATILEERNRLARELHDSVTQTLFSASVIAEATPRIWDKDMALGRQNMEQLAVMMRGALAEMRSLLIELRPDSVRDQTLGQMLNTLAEAARARTNATITLSVEGVRLLPKDVVFALHRIAQESLNNAVKYAEANEISVSLIYNQDSVILSVRDDGRGFDPKTIGSGHLGLTIMGERAQKIGADLQVESTPGKGTQVVVTWPGPGESDEYD